MHNLKEIRKNFETFQKEIEKRPVKIDFSRLKDLDIKNRVIIQEKESLEKEKKEISKSKDKSLFAKSKEISSNIEKILEKQKKIKDELEKILSDIPSIYLAQQY